MRKKIRHKCCCCDEIATYYIKDGKTHYYCENCIQKNKIDNAIKSDNGFEISSSEKAYMVTYDDVINSIYENCWLLQYKHIVVVESFVEKIFSSNKSIEKYKLMNHKILMSKIGNHFNLPNKYFEGRIPLKINNFKVFYNGFKKTLQEKKINY